ncbi:hypothetical protein AORI_0699 [Amycolatopsis keratiniphila]|uniref:Uncharacterized protein n=1 Tax=Amycolatopsis keratiniphila TaxID=129921 RepID=R4SXQ1_9PSEU|nr:hypothetical protein AORI_0699 [Amycolatopsis keratiniphila]
MPTSSTVGKRPAKVGEATCEASLPGCRRVDFSGLNATRLSPGHLGAPDRRIAFRGLNASGASGWPDRD